MTELLKQTNVAKLNRDLMQELEVVYLEYSERKGFPDALCTKISKDIADNLGLHYQEGLLKLDSPNSKGNLLTEHAWCEDAERTIVDLTAHQFNANLEKPLPKGVQIIRPENPLYKRYVPLNSQTKTVESFN